MIGWSLAAACAVACRLGRVVAAADVAALQADAQVQPLAAVAQAVLAAVDLGSGSSVTVTWSRWVQVAMRDGSRSAPVPSIGSQTWKVVPPGRCRTLSEPSWRSTTIRRAVSRPSPVPVPDVLGGEERVEDAVAVLGRDAGAVVGDVDDDAAARRGAVAIVIVPCSPSASIALSSRLVHTWLSSEPRTVSLRQRAVVVAHDLDRRVLELVAEHVERRLQPLVHVDLDELAAVHVGVGLDRPRRGRTCARSSPAARSARLRAVERGGHPARARRRWPGPASSATWSSHASSTPGDGERLGQPPRPRRRRAPRGARASRPPRRRRRARRARRARGARERSRCRATSLSASSRSIAGLDEARRSSRR